MVLKKLDYNGNCWWCGEKATTKEHIYKKSDFELIFGKNDFSQEDGPVVISPTNGLEKTIQGSKSKYLKYNSYNLCSDCNNSRSAPMDISYQNVVQYVFHNHRKIIREKKLVFEDIFQERCEVGKIEFSQYCLKHVACRIVESKHEVPMPIIEFLNGNLNSSNFKIKFRIRKDIHHLLTEEGVPLKFMHSRVLQDINLKKSGVKIGEGVTSIYFLNWFRILIFYSESFKDKEIFGENILDEEIHLTSYNKDINLKSLDQQQKMEFILTSIDEELGSI
jgi:hypothetical protein